MKRALTLLLAFILIAGLAACASEPEPQTSQPNAQAPEAAEAPAPAVEEPAIRRADRDPGEVSILFVGNSFSMALPGYLQALAQAHGVEVRYVNISAGGVTLNDSKDNAIREMQNGQFDYVVFQEQTPRLIEDTEGFLNDVRMLIEVAEENGVIPVLYSQAATVIDGRFREDLQNMINEIYRRAALEYNANLVNVGGALVWAYQRVSGYDYHGHLTHGVSTFFIACVFAATLLDLQIVDIDEDDAASRAFAQAAWEFVHS